MSGVVPGVSLRMKNSIALAPLLIVCFAASAMGQLKVGGIDPIVLRSGAGIARFTLTNPGNAAIPLDLKLGPVIDDAFQVNLPAPKVSFVMEAGEASAPTQIGAGQSLQLVVNLTSFSGSGAAHMDLFNQTTDLTTLRAVALDDPINVSINGFGSSDKPLATIYSKPAAITLKNESAEFVNLDWTFRLDGVAENAGTVKLTPGGSAEVVIAPSWSAYSLTDFVRGSLQTGQLVLKIHPPAGVASELLPAHMLPVSLTMMGLNSFWTTVASYVFVSLCLVIGGLLSILGSSVLPNILKKIDLKTQVRDLANRTSSVSTRVDSYLRVLLRLERKKIDVLLHDVGPFSLTATDEFSEAAVAIDRLTKRLVVAERLDEMRRRFEDVSATSPPSITDAIDKTLQSAAGQLHSFVLPDDDVDTANCYLDKAGAALKSLDDMDAQAKLIAANFTQLKARLQAFPPAYYADLKAALPGIFAILDNPFDDAKNIYPPMYFAIDHGIAAAQIALNYAMVRATIPMGESQNCNVPGQTAMQRLKVHECELIDLLGTLSWRALRAATCLVQQMREDVYESDVLDQIEQKRAKIVFDTQRARPYLPVYFSIAFDDSRFNGAAAIDQLVIQWNFPGKLFEEGWKVCHYFQGTEAAPGALKTPITLSAQSPKGAKTPVIIETEIEVQPTKPDKEYSRAFAGGLRFLIAFGVALAGLESGALDQLAKLGFLQATMAIVALGFGADAVKNLLTQSSKPQTVQKPGS